MADIDVVKRSGSRSWIWWLLAAIAVVILVLMLTRGAGNVGNVPAGSSALPAPAQAA